MMVCELIDILKQYDPEQEVVCFDEWGAEQELTESGVSARRNHLWIGVNNDS